MNENLFRVLSNPKFWIALCLAIMISAVIAFIAQDIWDTFMDLRDEMYLESSLLPIDRPIKIGETLYDIDEEREVIYVGQTDNNNCRIVYQDGSTVFVIETLFENLRLIRE